MIDKGALIIEGFDTVYAIDRLSGRTKYWIDDFLKAKQVPNESTKSAVALGLIEKVRENIESPAARQEFCQEVIALCSDRDEVLAGDIKNVSERYVSTDVWDIELGRIIELKGFVNSGEISVPAKSFEKKLKKSLSRINLGHDIELIIPGNLLFNNVDFKADGQTLTINVILEDKNG